MPGDINGRLDIRRLDRSEIDALQRSMPGSGRMLDGALVTYHHLRFREQESGAADYLIAWLDGEPVGHVLVRWGGSHDAHLRELGVHDSYVEGLAVKPDHWSKGIGTAIMVASERAALARGLRTLGLAVGVENDRARRLYYRLGYVESGLDEFDATWTHVDEDGIEHLNAERCTYVTKQLDPEGSAQ